MEEKPTAETAEVLKLKLKFEHEERRLAHDEAQRAHEAVEAEAQKAQNLRLAELKEARELRELELKADPEKPELELKAEQEKALLEAEKEVAACERELKMASLGRHPPVDRGCAFDPARNIRLLPPCQEEEADTYFAHFEKVADSLNWPKESWVLLLQGPGIKKFMAPYQ